MGCTHSFRCALAHFHSCLPLFAPVHCLCLFTVCICSSFTPLPSYWPPALLVVQSMGHVHSFGCAFVRAHAHFCSCPLSFAPIPTYRPCALSVIHAHAQHPCLCVHVPTVVGCITY